MSAVFAILREYTSLKYESSRHGEPIEFSITNVWTTTHLASPGPAGIYA